MDTDKDTDRDEYDTFRHTVVIRSMRIALTLCAYMAALVLLYGEVMLTSFVCGILKFDNQVPLQVVSLVLYATFFAQCYDHATGAISASYRDSDD